MFTFYPEEAFLKPPENPIIYAWSILFFLNMLKPNFHLWLMFFTNKQNSLNSTKILIVKWD